MFGVSNHHEDTKYIYLNKIVYKDKPVFVNPVPTNFKLIEVKKIGTVSVIYANYPDSPTYEGYKIMVFDGFNILKLVNDKVLDPHFFPKNDNGTLLARFEPTDRGWQWAMEFAEGITRQGNSAPA